MRKLTLLLAMMATTCTTAFSQESRLIKVLDGEHWWGGLTVAGSLMPMSEDSPRYNLSVDHLGNQAVPLLVSNKGRYVWCDEPFEFQFRDGVLEVESQWDDIIVAESGETLRSAFMAAAKNHFPSNGKIPNEMFFSKPQYNTWIELMYNQNQADVMAYAKRLLADGYPAGVLMIDTNWQQQYGNYDFRADKFPDPKGMIEELHEMGFKVMLWVVPFVSPDSAEYRALAKKNFLLKEEGSSYPAIFRWWDGQSAAYDLNNLECVEYVKSELKRLQREYGVDGYKMDAGDPGNYNTTQFTAYNNANEPFTHAELWAKIGLDFEFNELRACWKLAGEPLVQRLRDKDYKWSALSLLITDILNAGVMGYAYTCPDMIGGGEFTSFLDVTPENIDQDLIVRSCQVHALMPMMQFSVAPWRVLDAEHNAICQKYAALHDQFGDYILELAHQASKSGEPIVRYMEYQYPNQGYEHCNDQFMLGDKYLVAPMITKGTKRSVVLPKGRWRDDAGKIYRGGKSYDIDVPIERLPYFEKM